MNSADWTFADKTKHERRSEFRARLYASTGDIGA